MEYYSDPKYVNDVRPTATKVGGYSPTLEIGAQSTPDSSRIGQAPLRQFASDAKNNGLFHAMRSYQSRKRDTEETIRRGIPWQTDANVTAGETRYAPNPRLTPSPETRATSRLSPSGSYFIRDVTGGYARDFNGGHFSMADHERNYEILGMAPAKSSRSTYRVDAPMNGLSVVDLPPIVGPDPSAFIRSNNVPSPAASFRAGG